MKKLLILCILTLLIQSPAAIAYDHECDRVINIGSGDIIDNVDIDIDHGSVIISEKRRSGDEIEITEDGLLYINDDPIETTEEQQELLIEYHDLIFGIYAKATDIGLEGAKIGLEGAGLGLKAIACLFKLIRSDYDEDDMDREMDRAASKLEAKAKKLEGKAERIEEMAEDLEDLHIVLGEEIPQLAELDWWYR